MRAVQKTFAEEFEHILVESDTSVRRLSRLSGVSRRTLENWLYRHSALPRYIDPILHIARALQLPAMDTDRLLLAANYPTLTRLRQNRQLPPDILLDWQLPPDSQRGQKNSALQHAQQLLRQMPWNEEVHREVMELLALNGRRSEALKQFEICRQALRDELGVEPSGETLALYKRIRRTAHFSRDNIPAIITPLIGRQQELETLANLLANPDVRLVTITGLGGIGKTRLALDVAWQHTAGQFRDGVAFVQLAALDSIEQLVPAIAEALHLPLSVRDENPALEHLLNYLKPKQTLLVLDNCEHLLQGMAMVVDILRAAPQVQILATSRDRLRLRAEHLFPLRGLPYDGDRLDHPAGLLFQGAAQRVNPDLTFDESSTSQANQLCHIVGGLPLALELAASWLDTRPVAAIVADIEESLDFLAAELYDMPPRHRSLRAVLESTWRRLPPQMGPVFAAMSAFRGSFSPEAAREVIGMTPNYLSQLVAHSLLQHDRETDRYQLHEILRQFSAEKMAGMPEFEQDITRRHFAYYNDLAQRGGATMRGGDQQEWMARLELEQSNIHRALDWASANDVEAVARLAISQHLFWFTTGRIQEAAQQYERLMPHQERLSAETRPWLFAAYAETINTLGRTQESIALQEKALPLFLEQGNDAGTAFIYLLRSLRARDHEFIDVSIQYAETGLGYAQTPGSNAYYETRLLSSLGDSLARSGRIQEAESRLDQGHQLCLERNDRMGANAFLGRMSFFAESLGKQAEARRLAEEHLAESRPLGMLMEEITALDQLGWIACADGDFDQAEAYTIDAIALARETNDRPSLASLDFNMADILMAKSAYTEALPFLREAIFLVQEIGNETRIALTMEAMSRLVWYCDKQNLNAIRWNASAKARLEASGQLRLPHELAIYARTTEDMEASLGKEEFTQVWAEGDQMPFEEALKELLCALPQEATAHD